MRLFGSHDTLDVNLVVLGEVPRERIVAVRVTVETYFVASVEVVGRLSPEDQVVPSADGDDRLTIREAGYDEARDQYDAEMFFGSPGEPEVTPLLWLTNLDLYQGSREPKPYVFGIAAIGGEIAAVSTARLCDENPWSFTETTRLRKQTIKQFGRSLGAEVCRADGCVMTFAAVAADLDEADEFICSDCRDAIGEAALR